MSEWILVIILLNSWPAGINTMHIGGLSGMIECFEVREIVVEKLKISGPQATCIEIKQRPHD
jgi:hypothetical protein